MACEPQNLDDMYQMDDSCPLVDFSVLAGAQLLIMLLHVPVLTAVVFLSRSKTCRVEAGLSALGGALMAPVLTGRIFLHRPLLLHPVFSVMFCIGTFASNLGSNIGAHEILVLSWSASQTYSPPRFRRFLSHLSWVVLIHSPCLTALTIYLIVRLSRSTERAPVITGFFAGFYILRLLLQFGPQVVMYLNMHFLEALLPEGTPMALLNASRARRRSALWNNALRSLPLAAIGLLIIFVLDDWQRYGGLFYLYVITPADFIFDLGPLFRFLSRLRQTQREEKTRGDLSSMAQQLNISEIAERGLSTMKAPLISTAPPAWERGVSYALLESFIASYSIPSSFTTSKVVELIIKPMTQSAQCSAWEAFFWSGDAESGVGVARSTRQQQEIRALLGKSTTMVSHSWGNSFVELVAVLRRQDEALGNAFFFLDAFCMNQHTFTECSPSVHKKLLEELKMSVSFPGRMVMVLEPWSRPKPLSRCWCLYEVYLASITNTRIEMAFGEQSQKEISQALLGNLNLAGDIAQFADIRKAEATVAADRQMIFAAIQNEVGLEGFIELIRTNVADSLYVATLGSILFGVGTPKSFLSKPVGKPSIRRLTFPPQLQSEGSIVEMT